MTELMSTLEKLHRLFGGSTVTVESVKRLDPTQRRLVFDHLLADGVTVSSHPAEDPEVLSPHTGLPQKLRGAIHELTRNYPINLIVDAAMLEVDDELVREAIARAFLPREERKPLREKLGLNPPKAEPKKFTWVVGSTRGAVLGTADEAPEEVRIVEGGQQVSYTRKRVVPEYDFRQDENAPQVRQLAVYSKDGGQ